MEIITYFFDFYFFILEYMNIYSNVESKLETKLTYFSNQSDSDYSDVLLVICRTKKLFEFPVERDFANEKAFNAAQYPPLFHLFLRIRFFNIEARFFGTAIRKLKDFLLLKLDVKDIYCLKQIIFYFDYSFILTIHLIIWLFIL